MSHPVHVGCSGWNYRDWREVVYPKGLAARRWLERYAQLFDTVEVNATFYRLIAREAVAGWVEQTPPGFIVLPSFRPCLDAVVANYPDARAPIGA